MHKYKGTHVKARQHRAHARVAHLLTHIHKHTHKHTQGKQAAVESGGIMQAVDLAVVYIRICLCVCVSVCASSHCCVMNATGSENRELP